jgi:hypothetical protein
MVEYGAYNDGYELCYGSCSCYTERADDGTDFCSDCFETRDEHLEAINEESDDRVLLTTREMEEVRFIMTRDVFEESKSFIEEHKDSTDPSIMADVEMLTQIRTFFEENPVYQGYFTFSDWDNPQKIVNLGYYIIAKNELHDIQKT